jgi:hypothetical protein
MKLIQINPFLCVTHKTNPEKVAKYSKLIDDGVIFPPIEVMFLDGRYIVKDGNHRTKAHQLLDELVWAYVFEENDFESKWLLGKRLGKNYKN